MSRLPRFVVPVIVFGTLAAHAASGQPAPTRAEAPNPYLRFTERDDGSATLETSVVTLRDGRGREVALVSAVHIGDAAYYDALSARFSKFDAVLYELVAPEGTVPQAGNNNRGGVSMLQHMMKNMLGLSFQLDRVNYAAANFVHADLTADVFARMQADRGESLMGIMLQSMLDEMMNPSGGGGGAGQQPPEVQSAMLFAALVAPDRPRQLKLILGRQFENLDEKMARLTGPDGSVLVTERNKAAVAAMTAQLAAGKKKLAIFYGAAHMRDMQQRVEALGFRPVGSEWVVAWDVPKAAVPATQGVGATGR